MHLCLMEGALVSVFICPQIAGGVRFQHDGKRRIVCVVCKRVW